MATTKSTRTRKAAAPKVTVGKSGYALGQRRTEAQWDELCKAVFIPHLEGGGTMTALRQAYGPSRHIRNALRRAGKDPIRARRGIKPVSGKAKVNTLVKHLTTRRQAGASWDLLEIETGKPRTELKAILNKAGQGDLAHGRVILRTGNKS